MKRSTLVFVLLPLIMVSALYSIRNFGGEVATLYTTDAGGRTYTTQLWVIDHGHEIWIRSLHPTSPWLDRLINQPEVQLQRGQAITPYRAVPLAHRRTRINALMAEKYGWAEWLLSKVEDREEAIPVYLDPLG